MTVWLALLSWPFLSALFFRVLSVPAALTATIVGGYLFLPGQTSFDLPALPPLDKTTVPSISAFLALLIVGPRESSEGAEGVLPRSRWTTGFIAVMGLGSIGTVVTNSEPIFFHGVLPGLRLWDMFSVLLGFCITLLPFLMARKYLASAKAQETALKTFVLLAAIYAFLALYEVRMSPQLNAMIYGFFPHEFAQHVRSGGYRPVVFLNHGLWLSLFLGMATLAAIGLFRAVPKEQKAIYLLTAILLYGTLFLSKSLGAFLITNLLILLSLMSKRVIGIGLIVAVGFVLTYPLLRSVDLVPTQTIVELARAVNNDRARSAEFRFLNEDALLEHARKKPVFGWGAWLRNRAVSLEDGRPATPDGAWIIAMGLGGYVGFLTTFGLLSIGVLAFALGRPPPTVVAMTVALLLTANLIDLLPNATQTTMTWLWAGALAGRMERRQPSQAPTSPLAPTSQERASAVYARSSTAHSPYRRDLSQRPVSR